MKNKIAILRGINVGGRRKILMADLKSLCEKLGWKDLKSYIQSGNLIFNSTKQNSELELELETAIGENYGFDVPVIVRDSEELQTSISNNPFYRDDADINQLYLTFLKHSPDAENVRNLAKMSYKPDKFEIMDKDVFVFCEGKYHQSKLSNAFFEKKLGVGATTRNWKTVLKLVELANS